MVNDPLASALVLLGDLGLHLGKIEDNGCHLSGRFGP